jgi:hypothetical protein
MTWKKNGKTLTVKEKRVAAWRVNTGKDSKSTYIDKPKGTR